MAGIRAVLGVLVASVVLTPAAAWACEEHDPDERERVAGRAGQTVSLEIPNTLEGAEWAIAVEDDDEFAEGEDESADELAEGEDESAEEGVEAEFEVPDFGEEQRNVHLVVAVTHEADGADWSYEVVLEYGRPAPEPPKQAEPEPAPPPDERPPPPAPERTSDAETSPAPAASAAPPPPPAPATPAQAAAPAPAPLTSRAPVLPGGKAPSQGGELDGIAAEGTAAPAQVAGGDQTQRAADARSRGRSRRRSRRPVPQALPAAPARPRQHEPAPQGGLRLPEVDLPGLGSGLAWSLIGGGSLAFALAGLGVAGLGRHRRRRGRRALGARHATS